MVVEEYSVGVLTSRHNDKGAHDILYGALRLEEVQPREILSRKMRAKK